MFSGLLCAITAAACSGAAATLQGVGARRMTASVRLNPRLLWRMLRCGPYATGLALDGASFGLNLAALRSLPLFVVQAVGAANLAVIAGLATVVLRHRLRHRDWYAVLGVVCGVALLAVSARPGPAVRVALAGHWGLLLAAAAITAAAFVAGPRLRGAAVPGLLAGLTFGAAAIAGRMIAPSMGSVATLAASPATYVLVLGGVFGTMLYATALQRGSVTAASAMTIVGQTAGPAATGWFLLGDGFRTGFATGAVAGFVLTIASAVALVPAARTTSGSSAAPRPESAGSDHPPPSRQLRPRARRRAVLHRARLGAPRPGEPPVADAPRRRWSMRKRHHSH